MAHARVKLTGMASYTYGGRKLVRDKPVEINDESAIRHYESMKGRVEVTRLAEKKTDKPAKALEVAAESKVADSSPTPWSSKSSVPELREALRSRDIAFGDETKAQLLALLQELEPSKGEG